MHLESSNSVDKLLFGMIEKVHKPSDSPAIQSDASRGMFEKVHKPAYMRNFIHIMLHRWHIGVH